MEDREVLRKVYPLAEELIELGKSQTFRFVPDKDSVRRKLRNPRGKYVSSFCSAFNDQVTPKYKDLFGRIFNQTYKILTSADPNPSFQNNYVKTNRPDLIAAGVNSEMYLEKGFFDKWGLFSPFIEFSRNPNMKTLWSLIIPDEVDFEGATISNHLKMTESHNRFASNYVFFRLGMDGSSVAAGSEVLRVAENREYGGSLSFASTNREANITWVRAVNDLRKATEPFGDTMGWKGPGLKLNHSREASEELVGKFGDFWNHPGRLKLANEELVRINNQEIEEMGLMSKIQEIANLYEQYHLKE